MLRVRERVREIRPACRAQEESVLVSGVQTLDDESPVGVRARALPIAGTTGPSSGNPCHVHAFDRLPRRIDDASPRAMRRVESEIDLRTLDRHPCPGKLVARVGVSACADEDLVHAATSEAPQLVLARRARANRPRVRPARADLRIGDRGTRARVAHGPEDRCAFFQRDVVRDTRAGGQVDRRPLRISEPARADLERPEAGRDVRQAIVPVSVALHGRVARPSHPEEVNLGAFDPSPIERA